MAFFAREDKMRHSRSPPRRQGIAVGTKIVPPVPQKITTRDDLINGAIHDMNAKLTDAAHNNNNTGLGPVRFMNDTEERFRPMIISHRKPDNDIFGPPLISPRPKPRIRLGVSEEELQKIWHEDEAKHQAALKMERGTNLVQKMAAEPVNPVLPSARAKDAVPAARRPIELLSGTQVARNLDAAAPAGFSGMGAHSGVPRRSGLMCKPAEQFIPPELVQKPRHGGRRTKFPPDTFSFQDDAQTAAME